MKKQKQVQLKVNWSSPRKSITQVSCGLEMPSTFVTKKRNLSMSKIWKVKVILPIIVTVATPHDKKSDNAQNQNRTMQRMKMVSTLTCLINGHARLFISEKFETLPALIAPCLFIKFPNFVQPALLLGLPIFNFVPFSLASFIDIMTKFYLII